MERKRLRPDWPRKVYKYHIRLPHRGPDTWDSEMRLEAERIRGFWNLLCDLWTERTEKYAKALQTIPALSRLHGEIQEAEQAERDSYHAYKNARRRDTDENRQEQAALSRTHKACQERLHSLYRDFKNERKQHKEALAPLMKELDSWFYDQTKWAYNKGENLPYWPSKLRVLEEFQTLVRKRLQGKAGDPRPKHEYLREAHFEWRSVSGGIALGKLLGLSDNNIGLDAGIDGKFKPAYIRIAKDVLLQGSILMHRPLPEETIVKRVMLIGRERHRAGMWKRADGTYGRLKEVWDWHLYFVVEYPPTEKPQHRGSQGAAIDLGWRVVDTDDIRLGICVDRAGFAPGAEIRLPRGIVAGWHRKRELQETSDKELEMCKRLVGEYLSGATLPDTIKELLTNWHMARARRLRRLSYALSQLTPMPPEAMEALAVLQPWQAKDALRWREINRLGERLIRRRRHFYRNLAHELCKQYAAIAVEEIDWSALARQTEDPVLRNAAKYRVLVAPGEFRETLRSVAESHGTRLIESDPAYTTVRCWHCGNEVEASPALVLECANGHQWDQDENAARNLYRSAFGAHAASG